jgi:hypothetical protein
MASENSPFRGQVFFTMSPLTPVGSLRAPVPPSLNLYNISTLDLIFYPENGGRNFFQKVFNDLSHYKSHPNSSNHFLFVENKIKHINTICGQSIELPSIETCCTYSEKVKLSM